MFLIRLKPLSLTLTFTAFFSSILCFKPSSPAGKYCGNRPMKLRKSTWKDRDVEEVKKNPDVELKRLGKA